MIRPILCYGVPGWHPTTKENVHKLQLIQNRASRFVFGKMNTHMLDRFIMSHENYLKYMDCIYFFKIRNGLLDCHVTDAVVVGRPIRGQEGVNRLVPPRARTSMYQQNFVYRSTSAWNDLPCEIKLASVNSYKSLLHNHYLSL